MRSFETEFIDFRTYNINHQFKELYNEVHNAYRRADKVSLVRHCSEGMNTVSHQNFFKFFYSIAKRCWLIKTLIHFRNKWRG